MSLLLGIFAAALAWQLNKLAGRRAGAKWVYLAPLVEEVSKTTAAVLCGGDILLTHLSFGAVEGLWEYINRRNGYYAGLAAVASHSIFGYITMSTGRFSGSLALALAAGVMAHTAWNWLVVKYLARRDKYVKEAK